jgi:hypothetical protein
VQRRTHQKQDVYVIETLKMPTELVAQNGATTHQTTQVSVTGCVKAKPAKKTKKKQGKTGKKSRK